MNRVAQKLISADIQDFKRRLERERNDAVNFIAALKQERHFLTIDGPQDVGDICVTNLSRESLFERTSQKNRLLGHINLALRNIENGSFGVCSECGEPINRKRLDAMPWTSYCLACQEELEAIHTTDVSSTEARE